MGWNRKQVKRDRELKFTVTVDRELELTVEVMASGVVSLQATDDVVKAKLNPGDTFVLVLQPVKSNENRSKPPDPERPTWNHPIPISDSGYFGANPGVAHPSPAPIVAHPSPAPGNAWPEEFRG